MTLSDDHADASQCSLKAALSKSGKPGRFIPPRSFAIEPVVRALEQRFGGVPVDLSPPRDLLKETEERLIAWEGDISRLDLKLDPKQLKAVRYRLWASPREWSENDRLINDYLHWVDQKWRIGPRRLWVHYLLNMDPGSLATRRLGPWLGTRADRLTPTLRDFSEKWTLFEPHHAIAKLAQSLLTGAEVIPEIEGLRIGRETLLKSAFLLSVLESLGQQLRGYDQASGIAGTLKSLLADLGETPTYKMQGSADLRQSALKSLVEGLVAWTERQGQPAIVQTLDLLYFLIGDPRLPQCQGRWKLIATAVRETVERWLTKITIDAFFRVMLEIDASKPWMVSEREHFWRRYQNSISNAWLITGVKGRATKGQAVARKLLGESFSAFESGALADHCALRIQLGSQVILEMNYDGGTLFWPAGDGVMPRFYGDRYDRTKLRNLCNARWDSDAPRFRMTHQGKWQERYRDKIRDLTGIDP